jgi:hypothetical protein
MTPAELADLIDTVNLHWPNGHALEDDEQDLIIAALRSQPPAGFALVPVEIVRELAAIGEAVCDLAQNRKRPDSVPIMGWDDAKLTLGTVRKCRTLAAAPSGKRAGG